MSATIYRTLNAKIQEILATCTKVKVVYAYPAKQIDKYPAAIFYPSTFENRPGTNRENFKTYGYKLWIVVNAGGTTVDDIFDTVMPNVLDEVLSAFDAGWSFSNIDGHRVWGDIETGGWTVDETQAGIEVTAEIDLKVKCLTNNN